MANQPDKDQDDRTFAGAPRADRRKDKANDSAEKSGDPAAGAKSPLEDNDWRDQSQGPSHPRDDQGNKKA